MQARQKNQLGDIVNYMGSDSESVADFALILADLLYAFGMIIAIVAMLFYYIGWSTLSAIAVLLILAPLTKIISKTFTVLDDEMMAHRDQRVTLMTQALNAIRVVKYFAWEKSVIREVNEVRAQELAARSKLARAETTSSLGYLGVSTFVLFAALATHAWRGEKLDAALIFTCISLFGLLEGPFGDLSRLISRFTQAKVGARRILHFLKQEEVPEKTERLDDTGQSVGLTVEHLTVSYNEAVKPVLQNISFQVAPGKSLAVVGPVGSGKSSLIYSLLGEIPSSAGSMTYTGLAKDRRPRVAYVPQEAYIVNTSLLENLKFGEEVSGEEIRRSLVNACLDKDLKEWKAGLRTEIGEKGVNLSGGQKQRVALARAYLSRPQVVLLDDPLSAVDADTENLLCERLLFG
ncbi:MAG TPA: ATP-binding cassette domain-containing protein, partial [Bdellovibrio sp.]|nr:ATP-binding cassette domain-containing protein [Bdellovibrio sp.]